MNKLENTPDLDKSLEKHLAREKGKPIPIVCTNSYEFEGRVFLKGEISYRSWGRNCPDSWKDATLEDLKGKEDK